MHFKFSFAPDLAMDDRWCALTLASDLPSFHAGGGKWTFRYMGRDVSSKVMSRAPR